MGIRQEHDKVLKLQVVQTLYGMLPYNERAQHEASFESACRSIIGEGWDDSGLSMESADGMAHYLRGVHSAKGTPLRHKQKNVMQGLALGLASLESRLEQYPEESLESAMDRPNVERDAAILLQRYGLGGLSTEGKIWEGVKLVGGILGHILNPFSVGSERKKDKKEPEKPFDPKNIDYSQVGKVADYIQHTGALVKKIEYVPVEGKVSGEGIVRRLTWGAEFDERDPVGFVKKKFAAWEKFYHAHEAAVANMSQLVMSDEKTTRAACTAAKDDRDKMDEILEAACKKLLAAENPTKVAEKFKPVWPNALVYNTYQRKAGEYNMADSIVAKGWKDLKEIRPLKKDEAIALIEWLYHTCKDFKKFTTVFDKARWSDHSDGDDFWDHVEQCSWSDDYAGLIYWQSCDQDFLDGIPDISEILMHLTNGIMLWIDRSFHDHQAEE